MEVGCCIHEDVDVEVDCDNSENVEDEGVEMGCCSRLYMYKYNVM